MAQVILLYHNFQGLWGLVLISGNSGGNRHVSHGTQVLTQNVHNTQHSDLLLNTGVCTSPWMIGHPGTA